MRDVRDQRWYTYAFLNPRVLSNNILFEAVIVTRCKSREHDPEALCLRVDVAYQVLTSLIIRESVGFHQILEEHQELHKLRGFTIEGGYFANAWQQHDSVTFDKMGAVVDVVGGMTGAVTVEGLEEGREARTDGTVDMMGTGGTEELAVDDTLGGQAEGTDSVAGKTVGARENISWGGMQLIGGKVGLGWSSSSSDEMEESVKSSHDLKIGELKKIIEPWTDWCARFRG
jgi:hypothetical protein